MNIFEKLTKDLQKLGSSLCSDPYIWSKAALEVPKDTKNGDISCNIAMIMASKEKCNPREIATKFKDLIQQLEYIEKVEIAGPGFLNFKVSNAAWHECLASILNKQDSFWRVNVGQGEKVNIEYVSANPTGPMHIGHARGAVYGDALANLLQNCGFEVTKEYYINDAGSQIDTLIESAFLRYKEAYTKEEVEIPEGLYPGDYLKGVGEKLAEEFQGKLLEMDRQERKSLLKQIVVDEMMALIKSDLADLGVYHDVFFSETTLHEDESITNSIDILKNKGLLYTGTLPPPKGKLTDEWQEQEQLLFKSTDYGDDQDRAVQKNDGSWTYLAADFAYAQDKINRGFNSLVYILGADHGGYVKRIKGVIEALSDGKVQSDIRISQLVNFVKDDKPMKMSKRSGNFMTVNDVTSQVSKDIIRFIMLTRRSDMVLDFDFDKVKEQSKDNPVFYVQYAHVRTKSILLKAKETAPEAYNKFSSGEYDLSLLNSEEELALIKIMASWPKMLASAAKSREPQKIAYYLIELATKFHSIWNLGKENSHYRFNIEDDLELTSARFAMASAVGNVIATGLEVIGVEAMEKM